MIKHFISLQWKSFFRSASFQTNLALKILMIFGALYMIVAFSFAGGGSYFLIKELTDEDPFKVINSFLIYYVVLDLVARYFLQKMPIVNIKPLLYLPIKKGTIVKFTLGKTVLSFFNLIHAFFFVPFSFVLIAEDYSVVGVIGWHLAMMGLIYSNNFLNVLINNKDILFYLVVGTIAILAGLQYFEIFNITVYTGLIFESFYEQPYFALILWIALLILAYISYKYFRNNLYLDAGLSVKTAEAKTENLDWLNRFGSLGTFLKNDIKLIKRNKRSKTTVITSVIFIFYGLLFYTDFFKKAVEVYDTPIMQVFAGIFVSGGFLFTFGQFVPSWDSAYYPLMMSQNIQYKEYLRSKWYLVVIATIISTVLASFYLFWGWETYLTIVVAAIYNIGVNAYLVLWGGAYIKTPIDLTSNKKAFGDKQAFNLKTMLLSLPKLLLPGVVYAAGYYTVGSIFGFILLAIVGLLGLIFKNKVFSIIETIYKKEKYKTIAAYKQKN